MKKNKITGNDIGMIASIIGIIASIAVIVMGNKTIGFVLLCSNFTTLYGCFEENKKKKDHNKK